MYTGLLNLFLIIILLGIAVGMINRYIPMAAPFRGILNFLSIFVSFIYILQFFHVIQQPVLPMIQLIG